MAIVWQKLAYEDNVITKATLVAKGDLIGASAASTPAILTAGTNGQVLTAASGEATGLEWAATGAGDFLADGTVPMTGDLNFAENQALDMIIHNVADAAALAALANPTIGKIAFQVDELAFYGCTVAA